MSPIEKAINFISKETKNDLLEPTINAIEALKDEILENGVEQTRDHDDKITEIAQNLRESTGRFSSKETLEKIADNLLENTYKSADIIREAERQQTQTLRNETNVDEQNTAILDLANAMRITPLMLLQILIKTLKQRIYTNNKINFFHYQ